MTAVPGRNPGDWALAVVDHMFTRDELATCVLVPSKRTKRKALDPIRVAKMRAAMIEKYQFDELKAEQVWCAIIKKINNKGRNVKFNDKGNKHKRRVVSFFNRITGQSGNHSD